MTSTRPGDGAHAGERRLWRLAALLSALLVVVAAAWQLRADGSAHSGVIRGGSGGRTVAAVEIVGGEAKVTVTARADHEVGYRADIGWAFTRPTVEESWLGDTLRLTPHCGDDTVVLRVGLGCAVRLAVTVPTGIPLRVAGSSGRISVSGLEGTVDAAMDSGTLTLAGLRGALRAHVGSGTLIATGLASRQADIRAGAGRAEARFLTPPDAVTAAVGAGRLDLTLPPESRYRVDCRAGLGRCDADGSLSDPASASTLDLSAGAGHVKAVHGS
ncbi:hypothetical protein ACIOD1_11010 [Streptomyces sp. NPDC088097]|uniref:hypothetical protein n=1 Tax=Streptomyces sp. NPDC088097 TaxID=3365823 RepID=UPI003801304B